MQTIINDVTAYLIELNDFNGYTESEMLEYIDHCITEFGHTITSGQRALVIVTVLENTKHLMTV